METIIKIGGSLSKNPKSLRVLCAKIGSIAKNHSLFIVPGGSKFADVARDFDKRYKLTPEISHKIAILGMDQYGFILSELIPNSSTFYKLVEYKKILKTKKIPVFLPSSYMFKKDPLENSWNVTSDSVAAYLAKELRYTNLILITDVDGLFTKDPRKSSEARFVKKISANALVQLNQESCVDKVLGKILLQSKIRCFIVNGRYPSRLTAVLNNQQTLYTLIF